MGTAGVRCEIIYSVRALLDVVLGVALLLLGYVLY